MSIHRQNRILVGSGSLTFAQAIGYNSWLVHRTASSPLYGSAGSCPLSHPRCYPCLTYVRVVGVWAWKGQCFQMLWIYTVFIIIKLLSLKLYWSPSSKFFLWLYQAVNIIREKALQQGMFKVLCEEAGAEHSVLLLHAEVKWLFRWPVMNRVVE